MMSKKTYLKRLTDSKFYEVTVQRNELTERFGYIGGATRTLTKRYPTEARANAVASERLEAKERKGYERSIYQE